MADQAAKTVVEENPDTDLILISHEINRDLYLDLCDQLAKRKAPQSKALLFLTTYGGDPDAGFRIARCLSHHYESVKLVVPYYCKSAGTLVAIGATTLAIGDRGELGPLDIQVANPSEMFERSSGLDLTAALEYAMGHAQAVFRTSLMDIRRNTRISTKLAGDLATRLAIGLVEPLYGQVDPLRLGETQRAMKVTHEYGARLNARSKSLKPGALNRLVGGYPSHGFVIDRKEARTLFKSVEAPTTLEVQFIETLWDSTFKTENSLCVLFDKEQLEGVKDAAGKGPSPSDVSPPEEATTPVAPAPPGPPPDQQAPSAAGLPGVAAKSRRRVRR